MKHVNVNMYNKKLLRQDFQEFVQNRNIVKVIYDAYAIKTQTKGALQIGYGINEVCYRDRQ